MKNFNTTVSFYVDDLVHPHFSFSPTHMLGNPGIIGDDGEYNSPVALRGLTPEEWLVANVGPADKWR